jgi:hypothetical protein
MKTRGDKIQAINNDHFATSDEILQNGLEHQMGGFDHRHQQNAQCKAMAEKKRNGNSKT